MKGFIENEEVVRYFLSNNEHQVLDSSRQNLLDRETETILCSVEEFRKDTEDLLSSRFDVFFGIDDAKDLVFRCKECDTIIWGGTDHRFDPHLYCPHCGGYHTWLPYWTLDDLWSDKQKQRELDCVIEHSRYVEYSHARYDRKKLYDWEAWSYSGNKWHVTLAVKSMYYTGLKGLSLHIGKVGERTKIVVPLSWSAIYDKWIYPHTAEAKEFAKLPF